MAPWLILIIMAASAFIGAALTLHATARYKQTSGRMLEQYRDLLADVRQGNEQAHGEKEKGRESGWRPRR
jgi:Ni/Co efflux regulator RcnB